jgi:hypothetical protein
MSVCGTSAEASAKSALPRKECIPQIHYTAKRLYRKFEANIPRNETVLPIPNFYIHVLCERFIYSQDRSAYYAAGK